MLGKREGWSVKFEAPGFSIVGGLRGLHGGGPDTRETLLALLQVCEISRMASRMFRERHWSFPKRFLLTSPIWLNSVYHLHW